MSYTLTAEEKALAKARMLRICKTRKRIPCPSCQRPIHPWGMRTHRKSCGAKANTQAAMP